MGLLINPYANATGGGGGPPPTTPPAFLCRFSASPPVDEVSSATGALSGNASVSGGKLNCDGAGDYVTFTGGSQFDMTADWTFEAHVDPSSLDGSIISRASSGATKYQLYINNSGQLLWIINATTILTGSASLYGGGEHHVAVVADSTAGRWTIYIDGNAEVSAVSSLLASNATTNVLIGATTGFTGTQSINGTIDRVKITKDCLYPYANGNFTPPSSADP